MITFYSHARCRATWSRSVGRSLVSFHFAFALGLVASVSAAEPAPAPGAAAKVIDYKDPDYGSRVRHLRKEDGHEHNLYYHRDPWNADGSRLLGIHSDLQQKNWKVVLYDGDGQFLKELFAIDKYDWRLVWDRNDAKVLYTWRGSALYRLDTDSGDARQLKSFAPLGLKPNGPSLNQAGDRILVITSDNVFRSFRLPGMEDERTFMVPVPEGCFISWDKPAYTGCKNQIHVALRSNDPSKVVLLVYEDTGKLVHRFAGIGGGGHYDFSPDGKLAYFKLPGSARGGQATDLEIHVVNLDGTNDRVLYRATRAQAAYVQNLHLSWPDNVSDWFLASFFPTAGRLPAEYAAPLDEILMLKLDGTTRFLGRTGTAYSRAAGRGGAGDMFWAQPLASPAADGRRVCFNSIRAGTIDQHILYVEDKPAASPSR